MPTIEYARRFKKDLRRLREAGWDMKPFERLIADLRRGWPPPTCYEAHPMVGRMKGVWDIHIRQNWVVFAEVRGQTVTLIRTGTHASLGI